MEKNGNEAILWTYRAIKNGPTGPLVPQISSRNLNGETFRALRQAITQLIISI